MTNKQVEMITDKAITGEFLNVNVEVPKGTLDNDFSIDEPLHRFDGIEYDARDMNEVLFSTIHAVNVHYDEVDIVEIDSTFDFQIKQEPYRKLMNTLVGVENTDENLVFNNFMATYREHADFFSSIVRRGVLVSGLAIASLSPGAEMKIYGNENPFKKKELLVTIKHEDVRAFVNEYIDYAGNFEVDYQNAFDVLWTELPFDYTGQDSDIVPFSHLYVIHT